MMDFNKLKQELAAIRRAAEIFASEHAKTADAKDEDLLKVATLYPSFDDFVKTGKKIIATETPVVRDKGILYKVAVDTIPDANMPPDKIATNFVRINDPEQTEYIPWERGSWAKGAKVTHIKRYWVSDIDSNTREPGTPDCLWTEVYPNDEVEQPPAQEPLDPNDKNSNGTIRWDTWKEPKVMTDYFNTGDGITHEGIRKVSVKDFNADPPDVATSWDVV